MSDFLVATLADVIDDRRCRYLAMTAEERLTEFNAHSETGIEACLNAADVAWAARENGDDMTPYKHKWRGMLAILIKIGAREILPQTYRTFWPHGGVLDFVARLAPADQQRACDEPFPVVVNGPGGEITTVMRRVEDMTKEQRALVFDDSHKVTTVRAPAAQEAHLRQQSHQSAPKRSEKHGRFGMDDETITTKLGNYSIPFAELDDLYRECRRRGWHKN